MADKPAILQATTFTVEEGFLYRASRTLSIWLNKLFFSSLVLLVVWLLVAQFSSDVGCAPSVNVGNGTADEGISQKCSVWLTPTAKYLGAMAVLSFLLSIAFGALGLVVGKRIVETTPAAQEVGARSAPEEDDDGTPRGLPPQRP
jgi:hypothetical protein